MNKLSLMLLIATTSLFGTSLTAAPADGDYTVKVPSNRSFKATVRVAGGKITGMAMQRNTVTALAQNGLSPRVEFNGDRCGSGSYGTMTFQESGSDLVMTRWTGVCNRQGDNIAFDVDAKTKAKKN